MQTSVELLCIEHINIYADGNTKNGFLIPLTIMPDDSRPAN